MEKKRLAQQNKKVEVEDIEEKERNVFVRKEEPN